MDDIPFTLATGMHERARPLAEGRAKPKGIDLTTVMLKDNGGRHDRFLKGEFDGCELSFAVYLTSWARKAPFEAIPVFFNRQFRHGSLYVNSRAGIREPKQLEGKRIGILSWLNSAALWARGMLRHEYGLDATRVKWVAASPPEVPGFELPAGIQVSSPPGDAPLTDMLVAGEIDALITPRTPARDHPRDIVRLFPKFQEAESQYYRKTGVFPMSHALVVRSHLLEQYPGLAESLFDACQQAKTLAFEYADDPEHSTLAWFAEAMEREADIFGANRWPYGIEPNRKSLEGLVTYAHESGLLPEKPAIDDLFHPSARKLGLRHDFT